MVGLVAQVADPRSALEVRDVACHLGGRRSGGTAPEVDRFLEEAGPSGYAGAEPGNTHRAVRLVTGQRQEESPEVLETHFQLVLDGTPPEGALEVARALARRGPRRRDTHPNG